jgi:hypothetical protein
MMRSCTALSLLLLAIAAPALADEPLHLPSGLTIGGAAGATQVQIFKLNNLSGSVSPSLSRPGANLSWQTGEATTVQLGAALSRDHFSVAPVPGSNLGLTQLDVPAESQFTLRIDHALSETVQLAGTAGALRQSINPDGSAAQTQYLVGAHVGIRF